MYYMRSDDSPVDYALWKSPEDTPFIEIIRNALGSWVSALLRHLVVVSSACRPGLRQRGYHMAWIIDREGDDGMGLKSNRGPSGGAYPQKPWGCTYHQDHKSLSG